MKPISVLSRVLREKRIAWDGEAGRTYLIREMKGLYGIIAAVEKGT